MKDCVLDGLKSQFGPFSLLDSQVLDRIQQKLMKDLLPIEVRLGQSEGIRNKGLEPFVGSLFQSNETRRAVSGAALENLAQLLPPRPHVDALFNENPEVVRELSLLLNHHQVLEYLPRDIARKIEILLVQPHLRSKERLLFALRYLPDTPEAMRMFNQDLDRFLLELQSNRDVRLAFDPSFPGAGLSSVGKPMVRSKDLDLPWNTIRFQTDSGFEDWADFSHIDFSRYSGQSMRLRPSGKLAHLAPAQFIHQQSSLPKVIATEFEAFKVRARANSRMEQGFVSLTLENGEVYIVPISASEETRLKVSSQVILDALKSMRGSPESKPSVIDIFHSHPSEPDRVSTSLSLGDISFAQALQQVVGPDVEVRIHAAPVSLLDQGVIFSSSAF